MLKDAILARIHEWTSVAPLLASVFAPFSILFDIPALTEPWFIRFDPNVLLDPNALNGIPDRPGSLALSALGLAFNVFANALLIVRFSTTARWWRIATRLSLVFWTAKVTLALVNLAVFGRLGPGEVRGEGLWCAVVSLIISGLITFLLICHWIFDFNKRSRKEPTSNEQMAVRIAGRHFMLNVTFFVFDLGLLALIASQVENWTYLQGIYFVTETYLTIGFGDFYATHTVTRVLLFFFAVVGIAQLGNIVGMLVEFFHSRSADKRAASQEEYERRLQEQEDNRPGNKPDLDKEIEFLHHLGKKQETRTRFFQLAYSLTGLVVFWVVGAVVFSHLEGWAYGTALYFAYVSFLTIGYGDYTPITAAGRVVFVLYAIIAVPIMASFAVQAVQQVFAAFSARQYDKTRAKKGLDPDIEHHHAQETHDKIVSHADFVEKWHRDWEERVRQQKAAGFSEGQARELADRDQEKADRTIFNADGEGTATQQEREFDHDARLTEQVLEYALLLELRARKLLITTLDAVGNKRGPLRAAKLLLKADRNVQLRDIKALLKEIGEEQRARGDKNELEEDTDPPHLVLQGRSAAISEHVLRDDPEVTEFPTEEDEDHQTLQEIQRYREDFANLLAAGSRLMRLKGSERALFERRRIWQEQGDAPGE